ncbi:hypothetical protein [Marinobacter arenosus]|uniref:hypothetical protein n=1 Tax=Marinobacter arenosus TaxID=2856822 RepID=UPI001C4BF288|nr:hypothetical protein [Marinobacter arenosus]MBW0149240.1 hypothetical protein [Marinobacter arenosus]
MLNHLILAELADTDFRTDALSFRRTGMMAEPACLPQVMNHVSGKIQKFKMREISIEEMALKK